MADEFTKAALYWIKTFNKKVKEKIWMQKLIELLNEYEKDWVNEFETYVERWYCERTYQILSGKWENSNELKPCEIISKRYWFIKWLVDNEKINLRKLDYRVSNVDIPVRYYLWTFIRYSFEKEILMTLAIQDEPIRFLCEILKDE